MWSILIAWAVVTLAFNLTTFSFFWYETANGPHRERLHRLSGGRTGWWMLRAFLWGCVGVTVIPITYPLSFRKTMWQPPFDAACQKPLVFLVHGLYHNPSAWVRLRRRLRSHGYRNFFACGYSSWRIDFDQVAAACRRQIEQLIDLHPDTKLVLIGHSMGGLVIRTVLTEAKIAERVEAVITLGTPYRGSKLAVFAWGRLGRSISLDDPVMSGLENIRPALPTARLALVSPTDNMVLPNEACLPEEPDWTVEYTGPVSHVGLLYHGPTIGRVVRFIEEARSLDKE